MVLDAQRTALRKAELAAPEPGAGEVLLEVSCCGVCRTDLHVVDGELTEPKLPLVPGHQIVGRVVAGGPGAERFAAGDRVGVPWLGWTCGECRYCLSGRENLCPRARFTGYQRDGGYAEQVSADERFCFPIPEGYPDLQAAPLLCAGLIGQRALGMAGDAERLGVYGFGAAAAIVFAPAGALVPAALRAVAPGGPVVCAGIHMSDIPSFPYELLWEARVLRSVANLTRDDARELLALAPRVPVRTTVHPYPLEEAEEALRALRAGEIEGSAVIQVAS